MPAQPFGYYEIVYILFPGILEAMMAMTLTRVLTMRSNTAFYVVYAIDFIADAILIESIYIAPFIAVPMLIVLIIEMLIVTGRRRRKKAAMEALKREV